MTTGQLQLYNILLQWFNCDQEAMLYTNSVLVFIYWLFQNSANLIISTSLLKIHLSITLVVLYLLSVIGIFVKMSSGLNTTKKP